MKKWVQIGQLNFKYKKEALAHFKKILNSYGFKESLSEEDFNDVLNLLKIHPNAKEKIGVGIKKIKVDEIKSKISKKREKSWAFAHQARIKRQKKDLVIE